jgi:hypothetical protein
MILYQFYITPAQQDLHDVYIGYWWRARLGRGLAVTGTDDCNKYYPELNMMSIYDTDRDPVDDGIPGPQGMIVFPPENIDPQSYTRVYSNVYDIQAKPDEIIYDWLAADKNFENSCDVMGIRPWQQCPIYDTIKRNRIQNTWPTTKSQTKSQYRKSSGKITVGSSAGR